MYEYQGVVTNVVDGDTFDITVDLGLRITSNQRVRLYGIDTPERGQPGFMEATTRLRELILDQTVVVRTIKPADKYGRWLADAYCPGGSVAGIMIAENLGVAYFGGTKL